MKNVECRNNSANRANTLRRAIRHSLFVILLGIVCLLLPAKGFSQSSNRWLFVFNTSASMRNRAQGIVAVTQDLLTTAMHGNIRSGDAIGIWTYDKALRADEAPLQTWHPDTARSIAEHTIGFLSHHRYENPAAFGDVLTNMLRVVKISDVITIILVSDASDPIKGTPFDARINTFYKTNYQHQRKERMPVVTVFRGEKGVITTNTLTLSPWPVDIPPVPPPVIAKVVPPKPAPPAPPAPVVPSLVIIGNKAETTFHPPADLPDDSTQPTAPAATESKPAPPKTEVVSPPSEPVRAPMVVADEKPKSVPPSVASVEPTSPAAPATETPKPAPSPETVTANARASNPPPATSATPPFQPRVETAVGAPSQNLFSGRNIAIASVAFAVIVCGLLLLAARNARNASRASLITRSLDREGK
jgi:hypothetical protein